jgi:hypothetical protein
MDKHSGLDHHPDVVNRVVDLEPEQVASVRPSIPVKLVKVVALVHVLFD